MMVLRAETYFHEETRGVDSFCFCLYKILVVIGEMVDVEKEAYLGFSCRSIGVNPTDG